jgi:hypothetical protein
MPKAKSLRTTKPKAIKNHEVAAENVTAEFQYSPADLESEIRMRAYELYQQRGYSNGRQEEDWLTAEREVLARHGEQKHTA